MGAGRAGVGEASGVGWRADVEEPGSRVVLAGRLDVRADADLRQLLAEQVQAGDGDLVVDLSAVTAVDATGLGLLVGVHRRALRAGRVLVLCGVPPPVARLLLVTRLHRVLHMAA